jgi:hypothetical protein
MVGDHRESADRPPHGLVRRSQNVHPVDFDVVCHCNAPPDVGSANELGVNLFPYFGGKQFGIVEPPMPKFGGQNDRGSHDWTSQRTAAGFVDPGNEFAT